MKKCIIIILAIPYFLSCSKTISETNKPKQFLSEDALEFDLIGRIKKIDWIVINSNLTGNDGEYYKGYFKGTLDSVKLLYNKDFKLIQSDLVTRSLRTFSENSDGTIVFKNENVILHNYTNSSFVNLSQTSYKSLIKENKLIDTLFIHQLFYNKYGDVKEAQVLDQEYFKKVKMTGKIEYEYDKTGNWVKRITFIGSKNDRCVNQTDIRKIEYQ